MKQRNPIHEIKAKIIYEGPEPGTLIQYFKDDDITEDEHKFIIINGKGILNNKISEHIFIQLNKIGIHSHFIRRLNVREQLIRESENIPLRVVIRNTAAGSLSKRLRIKEGLSLPRSIVEFYYKYDSMNDTLVSEEHITAFNWLNHSELEDITSLVIRINDFMTGLFLGIGIHLVDFSIEFGRIMDGDTVRIIIASEIFPDCCRLWHIEKQAKYNNKLFIQNYQSLKDYNEIARRLGIFKRNDPETIETTITPIRK
ncbi:phosphoribosylaminoimidazolesuccinocarboxamide synthase [Candidatus Liberibacter americanus]|uniref:Phosphoribosylaminoimidazole-succinocarboxamide synthase n=1 Tax=Candidatus Liberibacter americanus str. Sao Paulo TaxID=1261131 RepID=U6B5N9_9HYPH|nr:phosphoribosylaminoimidazolesuccinocarboxamide synthase [Candidatus Liberibacter americanus]AHA28143.1 Phosphoribosylaminoimidazole-succinocarboxamide synthase [Candidatus Liberibacter americanus str. Sao Paulo]EMS35945.1 phosphoribosylaminoimidazole-succinocarboxamide synthase [Candidatus Liberibacter americanus PW_SP]